MSDRPSKNPDSRHSNEFLQQAYALHDLQQARQFYERWARDYDTEMEGQLRYVAPRLLAEILSEHAPGDATAEVLDVGCGTGLTSHYLRELGYALFDGIDITKEMLDRARERGIYRALHEADITKPIALKDAQYDVVVSSGTFTLGHVDSQPLPELLRVLKPNGYLACTVHKDLWEAQGFRGQFEQFADDGVLVEREFRRGEFFEGLGETALYCIYQKPG
jgi:predicted TPR repeat methyltransferase